jgi:hypothetical protein
MDLIQLTLFTIHICTFSLSVSENKTEELKKEHAEIYIYCGI